MVLVCGTCASTVMVFSTILRSIDAVDQLKIFKLHGGRLSACVLGRDQFVDAIGKVFQDEILFGRGPCRR